MGTSGHASRGHGSFIGWWLVATSLQRRGGKVRRDVVEEEGDFAPVVVRVLGSRLLVAAVVPPVEPRLARGGDHARNQHQEINGKPGTPAVR